MTAVVRVSGATLDLESCLKWIPARMLENSWRPGERASPRRQPAIDAGFTLLPSDREDSAACQEEAMAELTSLASHIKQLAQSGAAIEVDFALNVGPARSKSIGFTQDFLRLVGEVGARLIVSAYPCSDE